MNEARAIELALATTIRQFAEVGPGVSIRPWQSVRFDTAWKPDQDRRFPCVDIRCAGPVVEDDQSSMVSTATVQVGTRAEDDPDHARISQMYGAVKEVLDALFVAFMTCDEDSEEYTLFKATLADELPDEFSLGGLSYGDPREPYDENGYNFLTLGFNIHHARTDY